MADGHCCKGAISSWQHPSCAMGCAIARHTSTVSECESACHAHDNVCKWSIAGMEMNNCEVCPDGCDAQDGVVECLEGCRHSFNGAWLFELDGNGKLFVNAERFLPNDRSSREGALAWDACGEVSTFDNGHTIWMPNEGSRIGAVAATGDWALRWSDICGRSENVVELVSSVSFKAEDGLQRAAGLTYLEVDDSMARIHV